MVVGARGTHTAADLTNAELLAFLQDKVLERLTSIDTHLATLNGNVARNVLDIAANKEIAERLSQEMHDVCISMARLEERGTGQKERLTETVGATKDLLAKAWDNAIKLAGIAALLAVLADKVGLW